LAAIPSGQIRLSNMRTLFLILIVSVLWTACDNEIIERAADFEFETIDKESNKINLRVITRYKIKSRLEKKTLRKYGRHYNDSLLLPVISSISKEILKDYSAGEIYNYKRKEIEQKLSGQIKTTFAKADLELTYFLIGEVGLSDTLMHRLEKEYVTRFQNAMNGCIKGIKGVVTDMRPGDPIVFYEFIIENKSYEGILNREEIGKKLNIGDSVSFEYACDEPIFHRLKK